MRRRIKTMDETFSPRFLGLLDAMACQHETPAGPRHCALCKQWLRQQGSTS